MFSIILVSIMAICFITGLVVLVFPFGEKKVEAINTTPTSPYAHRIASLDAIRDQARQATAADVHIFVMWFKGFQGYRSDIPASVRYIHMMEWRARIDELYKELPVELIPMWMTLVNRNPGKFSGGFR